MVLDPNEFDLFDFAKRGEVGQQKQQVIHAPVASPINVCGAGIRPNACFAVLVPNGSETADDIAEIT